MSALLRQTALNSTKIVTRALPLQAAVQVSSNLTTTAAGTALPPLQRSFQTSTVFATEQHEKDAEGLVKRDTLNPSRSENSESGTDDEVASHDASFDPSNTSPEGEMKAAGQESAARGKTSNPLDASPGNQEFNKSRDPTEGGAQRGVDREPSARGWTRKRKIVNEEKSQQ
jgi:hypothetical protein